MRSLRPSLLGDFPISKHEVWDASLLPQEAHSGNNVDVKRVNLPPDATPLARNVFRLMTEQKIGQKALALKAEVNETYVRDILSGKSKNPRSDQIHKLAKALGTTVVRLRDPRMADSEDQRDKVVDPHETAAIMRMWGILSDEGRDRVIEVIRDEVARDLARIRKTKDV